ncbi:MAG: dihydroorotase [Bacteroidales bacterium]|nr:dihydroorotase [Candidatus Physcousia equi]
MKTLIKDALLVNEGSERKASLLLEDDLIAQIIEEGEACPADADQVVDAAGMVLMPGVIDDHVHMRDPGMTHKADMETETRAAAAGGVTSVMDMPNVVPQTTTIERWEERMAHAATTCRINYAFYLGATNTNLAEVKRMDTTRIPALKLFMGSSTGGMLVDRVEILRQIFSECPTRIMAHCEDTTRINQRMEEARKRHGGEQDPPIALHPWIRDDEACFQSSALAVSLAKETGAKLHLAHITTARELELLGAPSVTAEVCPQHLFFCDKDYERLGSLIKCNPSIKSESDREALRTAARDGRIQVVGTDHAPHLLSEKEGGASKAVSGMPLVQFSLPLMLTMSDEGVMPRTRLVELMCHNPARLFGIEQRGFIRKGYKADLVLLKRERWKVGKRDVLSKCAWSPLEQTELQWRVVSTWCNGHCVFDGTKVDDGYRGEALRFTQSR